MALTTEHLLRHLPVMDCDRLTGLVSIGDLVKDIPRRSSSSTCSAISLSPEVDCRSNAYSYGSACIDF